MPETGPALVDLIGPIARGTAFAKQPIANAVSAEKNPAFRGPCLK